MFRLIAFVAAVASVQAATLSRLSLDDMIAKSSDIVRARVTGQRSAFRGAAGPGGMIYTWYSLQVVETLKGTARTEIAVPGGTVDRYRQTVAGAPELKSGDEYLFFIWTSKSGLPQIIGLSQGLLGINIGSLGKRTATRAPATETVIDPVTGKAAADQGLKYDYDNLKAIIAARLSAGGAK